MDLPLQTSYTSLREWMVADNSLSQSTHPLVRLGALYHLDEKYQNDIVIEKVRELLDEADPAFGFSWEIDNLLFHLHAAVYLANKNDFEGIKYILRTLVSLPEEKKRYAQIALGSCYRFPFATLLNLVFNATIAEKDIQIFEKLLQHSEDDFIDASQKPPADQRLRFESILDDIKAVRRLNGNSKLDLGVGNILQRPFRENFGFTHTGFISLDTADQGALVLPYQPELVINKNNPLMRQSTWVMQSAGRRVLVVYEADYPNNVKFIYLLPFATFSKPELESSIANLLIHGQGVDLAVVHSKWTTEKGEFCRWIARSGQTRVISNRSRRNKLGDMFILHPENPRPLRMDFSIGLSHFPMIEEAFAFSINLGHAVVVDTFQGGKDRHLMARIIRGDGTTLLRPVDKEVKPGTPAFYQVRMDENQNERTEIIYFTNIKIEGACSSCYGIGFEICPTCNGEIYIKCPRCNGTSYMPCNACGGTQNCSICGGSGRYFDTGKICVKCKGTGLCKYCFTHSGKIRCKEPGCLHGKIKCPDCQGSRVIECTCNGNNRGVFVQI